MSTQRQRICPTCQNPLQEYEHQGVLLDFCRKCGGSWFDEGEIAQYFLLEKDLSDESVLINPYNEDGPKCPKDGTILQEYIYHKDHSLRIDFCSVCYGVWLDRGEVKKLQDLSADLKHKFSRVFQLFNFES